MDVQGEATKLKQLYQSSSKVLENWPQSDAMSFCDDKYFAKVLQCLSEEELYAAVQGLQRQIEIEIQLVKCLEQLSELKSDSHDTTAKLITCQARVARLRSRLLRCLSKQLNDHGHDKCVLPSWCSQMGNEKRIKLNNTAMDTETTTTRLSQVGDVREGFSENHVSQNPGDSEDSEDIEEQPTCSRLSTAEDMEMDQLSDLPQASDIFKWVEPRGGQVGHAKKDRQTDIHTQNMASGSGTQESTNDSSLRSQVEDEPFTDLPGKKDTSKELSDGDIAMKKIQETLEKNLHGKGRDGNESEPTDPPPKPAPYRSLEKKKKQEKVADEQSIELLESSLSEEDVTDGLVITEQVHMQDWDPIPLLQDLFGESKHVEAKVSAPKDDPSTSTVVRMSGYMDKLPSSYKQKRSSVFKGWKKRHFKAFDGKLFYFEDHRNNEPLGMVDLKGSKVIISGGKILELIDSEGKAALKVRCATPTEAEDWKEAIATEAELQENQSTEETDTGERSVIVIDLGSSSVKAGFASEEAWPQVIFPCVCAELKDDESDCVYGFGALEPTRRKTSNLRFPLRRSLKIDKLKFSPSDLTGILEHTFVALQVDPSKHKVIMTLPHNTSVNDKGELVETLLGYFGVEACYLQEQAILAMYSYSAVSGIIVDVGDHIDVIPVVEGCVIESGASRLPYGGRQVTDMLARQLTEKGHRFFSEVETYITRFVKEQACYVLEEKIPNDEDDASSYSTDVMLDKYKIPGGIKKVTFDTARYRCTEGLFEPIAWGKDHPGIYQLTHKAIMACSMDVRKQMCRSIYLSGGGSMLPGFPERLQSEVSALLPPHSIVQVHAGTDRHHAAFIGASVVARLPLFEELCITADEWNDMGTDALEKWSNL